MDDVERISTSDRKQQQNFMILPFAIESRSMLAKKHNVMRMEALSLENDGKNGTLIGHWNWTVDRPCLMTCI